MNPDTLKEILRLHSLFLAGDSSGTRANLWNADLRNANLQDANLWDANLRGADLRGADLRGANLRNANLRGADLRDANLRDANLRGANLRDTNLRYADLRDAKLPHFQIPLGDIVGFKKLRDGSVCELLIPAAARRTASLVGRKCRAEYAIVKSGSGISRHDSGFKYEEGATVHPDSYDDDIRVECAPGIHFFCTRAEAEEY